MAIIRAKNFRGYSSKADDLIDQPEIAQDCDNVIINKGDICNIPHEIGQINTENFIKIVGFYRTKYPYEQSFLVYMGVGGTLYAYNIAEGLWGDFNFAYFNWFDYIRVRNSEVSSYFVAYSLFNFHLGKYIQTGNWLYHFAHTGNRMLKCQFSSTQNTVSIKASLIGMNSLAAVVADGNGSGSAYSSGNWDFAFSIVSNSTTKHMGDATPYEGYAIGDENEFLEEDDIESQAIIYGTDRSLSNDPKFKIYLKWGQQEFEPQVLQSTTPLIAVYAKQSDEIEYRFVGYFVVNGNWTRETTEGIYNGLYYNTVTVTNATQHTWRVAPTVGYRVPEPCNHVCFFKGRYYFNTIARTIQVWNPSTGGYQTIKTPQNILQVSHHYNEAYSLSGYAISDPSKAARIAWKCINYIDDTKNQPVGTDRESLCGMVEFLGQMVVFKETETYILTDDIETGELVKIFDVGCVSRYGAKAYIVINNILYWGARDGIYMWDGSNRPVKISEAIEEDLKDIDENLYPYMNMGFDPRYGLLYITFVGGDIAFIFHYNEEGKWTKRQNTYFTGVVNDFDGNVWFNERAVISKRGTLNDDGLYVDSVRVPYWKTTLQTLGDDIRIKHWKEFVLETRETFDDSLSVPATVSYDINDETKTIDDTTSKRCHLGIYDERLEVKFTLSSYFTRKPFRISGFSISAIPRGRR